MCLASCAAEHGGLFADGAPAPEVTAGGPMPLVAEIQALYAHRGVDPPAEILARYRKCKSVMTIDRAVDLETSPSPLLVSTVRFLLSRAGKDALLFPDDVPLVPVEDALAKLRSRRRLRGFEDAALRAKAREKAATRARAPAPDELRAIRMKQTLDTLLDTPVLVPEVQSALRSSPPLARDYAELLLERGPMPDAKAARSLGVTKEELARAACELDWTLREFEH